MPDTDTPRSATILADDFAGQIAADDGLRQRIAENPGAAAEALRKLEPAAIGQSDALGSSSVKRMDAETAKQAASADKLVYIIAVACLGTVSVAVVFAIFGIAAWQMSTASAALTVFAIPDGLIALGSAAIGALAGLLGPLSQRRG